MLRVVIVACRCVLFAASCWLVVRFVVPCLLLMFGVVVFGRCCFLLVFMSVVVPRGVVFVMCCWFGVVWCLLHAGVWCSLVFFMMCVVCCYLFAVSWCCPLYTDVVRRSLLVGVVGFVV